jgi:hypothetical protein
MRHFPRSLSHEFSLPACLPPLIRYSAPQRCQCVLFTLNQYIKHIQNFMLSLCHHRRCSTAWLTILSARTPHTHIGGSSSSSVMERAGNNRISANRKTRNSCVRVRCAVYGAQSHVRVEGRSGRQRTINNNKERGALLPLPPSSSSCELNREEKCGEKMEN